MFLRVRPQKNSFKFGKGANLSPQFVEPFEFIKKLGPVYYYLDLQSSLSKIHYVFQVSVLHHYILDPSHVIDLSGLYISHEGDLVSEPIYILD